MVEAGSNFDSLERAELKNLVRVLLRTEGPVGAPTGGPAQGRGTPSAGGSGRPGRPRPGDEIRSAPRPGRRPREEVDKLERKIDKSRKRRRKRKGGVEPDPSVTEQSITQLRKILGVRAATRTGALQALGISLRGVTSRLGAGVGITRGISERLGVGRTFARATGALELRALRLATRGDNLTPAQVRRRGRAIRGTTSLFRTLIKGGATFLVALAVVNEFGRAGIPQEATAALVGARGVLALPRRDLAQQLRQGNLVKARQIAAFGSAVIRADAAATQAFAVSYAVGQSFNRSVNDGSQAFWATIPELHEDQFNSLDVIRDRFLKQQQSGNFYGGWKGNDTIGS